MRCEPNHEARSPEGNSGAPTETHTEAEAGDTGGDMAGDFCGRVWRRKFFNESAAPHGLGMVFRREFLGASRRIQRPVGPPGADSRIVSELRAGLSLSPTNAFDRLRGRTHRQRFWQVGFAFLGCFVVL